MKLALVLLILLAVALAQCARPTAAAEPQPLPGTEPLTRPGHLGAFLVAHLDRSEDPVDLYRAWAPAHQVLRVRAAGAIKLRVLPRFEKTKKPGKVLPIQERVAIPPTAVTATTASAATSNVTR